jgi:hypothetical protein
MEFNYMELLLLRDGLEATKEDYVEGSQVQKELLNLIERLNQEYDK